MADEESSEPEVPEGAAVFPLIPEELNIHPLLLVALHAAVFFDGSDVAVVNETAADELLQYFATYFQRLGGSELRRITEDMETLIGFAREEKWPAEEMQFLQSFLHDFGVGEEA